MTFHLNDIIAAKNERYFQPKVENIKDYSLLNSNFYAFFGKRAFDILFVIASAPIALVLIGAAALLTMLDAHNPFFWQRRVGQNGKIFWMLKIRTMVPDAETKLEAHLRRHPAARREWEDKQKLDEDPRITRLGAFLRKSSLDELPQLWNVLIGDMSLVGPRPMMLDQRQLYLGRAYFELRPGLTGNWQISDRNECSFAARAVFDDDYAAKLSLKTDLEILVRTAGVVLRCTGR